MKAAWTPNQVREILVHINPKYQALATTAALLGARIGEILAQQWKHLDFESREVTISEALWRGTLQSTRTEHSVRVPPIHDYLLQTLSTHKERCLWTGPDDFVFCHPDGRAFDPDVLRNDVLYPAPKAAD